jgi:Putative Actinobacterial Holin-X, holin superfamily III
MAYERLQNSSLTRTLTNLLADLSDLVQKEIRLGRAEVKQAIANGVQASVWMALAALLGLVALVLVAEAMVFALASYGIALHWSCLIVAIGLAAAGAAAFVYGRSMTDELVPTRSVRQVSEDIRATREHLA